MKNLDNKFSKTTNIINGHSLFLTMNESKTLNDIIEFNASLSVANLTDVENYQIVLPKEIYTPAYEYNFSKKIKQLDKAINNNEKIRIWTSHFDADSYLLFLYLCDYLKDKDCALFVLYSDDYNEYCYSPSCMDCEELENLSKLEHKLTKEEIREFSKIWQYIKSKKCNMRILEDKKIKLVSFDYYNEIIINILKKQGKIRISELTALFMMQYYMSDLIVCYLIKRLITQNKIRITEISDERYFLNKIELVKEN